jgi:nitroimidazol reductase NimA-like FMN-containing flavoprotein (pyridoxamine 5'-phosphate oxidase superfamily)
MRRRDNEITDRAELERIIDEAQVLRLGLLDDGRPYVVPINFAREGDDIWFHGAAAGRKVDCLQVAPDVCIEVDRLLAITMGPTGCGDWTSHYESVIGFGRAVVVTDADAKRQGLRALMRKYSGREDWEFGDVHVGNTAVVRIRLTELSGKRAPATA